MVAARPATETKRNHPLHLTTEMKRNPLHHLNTPAAETTKIAKRSTRAPHPQKINIPVAVAPSTKAKIRTAIVSVLQSITVPRRRPRNVRMK